MMVNYEREGSEPSEADKTANGEEASGDETDTEEPEARSDEDGAGDAEGGETRNGGGTKKDVWDWGISDVQNVVGDIVGSLRNLPSIAARVPGHDLVEVPDEGYWLLMDMPGVERAGLDVSMAGDELTIAGNRERPELPEGSEVRSSGRSYGRFRREVRIPSDVDHDGVRAKLENGVLKVVLPRRTEQAPQRVEIEE